MRPSSGSCRSAFSCASSPLVCSRLTIVLRRRSCFRGGVVLAAETLLIGFALWVRLRSRPGDPIYVLSPIGVHYWHNAMFLIPWREIRGVETIDITTFNWSIRRPGKMTFHDVTVVLVSKAFYDTHIRINSLFQRGPAGHQIRRERPAGPGRVAPRHRVGDAEANARRGEGALACVPQPGCVRAGCCTRRTENQRAGCVRRIEAQVRPGRCRRCPAAAGIPAGNPKRMSIWDNMLSVAFLIGILVAGSRSRARLGDLGTDCGARGAQKGGGARQAMGEGAAGTTREDREDPKG